MCLDKVDKVTKKGTGIGYKVFGDDGYAHIQPQFQGYKRYQYHRWYADNNHDSCYYFPKRGRMDIYPSGYHIFLTPQDAQKWCTWGNIRKVKYEEVVASGTQERIPVIVARKMYIYPKKELND